MLHGLVRGSVLTHEDTIMAESAGFGIDSQVLQRFAREESAGQKEIYSVSSTGQNPEVWIGKIIGLDSYNLYNVERVVPIGVGIAPLGLVDNIQAINVAESFTQQGQLATGVYVLVFKISEKNVFYAQV